MRVRFLLGHPVYLQFAGSQTYVPSWRLDVRVLHHLQEGVCVPFYVFSGEEVILCSCEEENSNQSEKRN